MLLLKIILSLAWILLIGWDNVIRLWDLSNSSLDLVSEFDCGKPTSPCLDISFVNNVATVGTFNKKVGLEQNTEKRMSSGNKLFGRLNTLIHPRSK